MPRMLRNSVCRASAVSLSKVIDLRKDGAMRPNTAGMAEIVSAALFPASLAASDLRSCRTRTDLACLQLMRSPSQCPAFARLATSAINRGHHAPDSGYMPFLSVMFFGTLTRGMLVEHDLAAKRLFWRMLILINAAVIPVSTISYYGVTRPDTRDGGIVAFYIGLGLFLLCARFELFKSRVALELGLSAIPCIFSIPSH
ncbi:hypothetical protein M2322_004385 [Rhodoblastus acidophilus]|uniref:hypothetical protein n=1 Tax=Rhodoblastus acidophilus TaxID=1074 RepID=UPI002225AFAF|nr:hypothetical protein [Rhodoblastus acidophilus]MCW2318816.1 hypothetical protein [Rhodoblastus acidophilus]